MLKDVPGLNVVQTGGPGGQTSVFMRGTNSNHTKVLVDGIDVSDPSSSTGAFDFGQFLTQDIERVEVLRGPQSGLYGSDAIGGVINIITKTGYGPAASSPARSRAASFDTFNQTRHRQRLGGCVPLQRQRRALPRRLDAGDAARSAGAGRGAQRRLLRQPDRSRPSSGYDVTQQLRPRPRGALHRHAPAHHRRGLQLRPPTRLPRRPSRATRDTTGVLHARAPRTWCPSTARSTRPWASPTAHMPPRPSSPRLRTSARHRRPAQGRLAGRHQARADARPWCSGAEYERDEISQPLSPSMHIDSGYAELQSQLGEHCSRHLNVRYDDNSRFGSKVTYRVAPT